MPVSKRPRRAPAENQRRRDPERTKERILSAAVEEFGEHGYAGARVSQIAARAGVNAQLISYYFDGKAGLYQALLARWRGITDSISRPDSPIEEVVAEFVRASGRHRAWGRLMIWEALGDVPQPSGSEGNGQPATEPEDFLLDQVGQLRRRQAAGELPSDLDPGHLLLALFAMASAPTVLPRIARRILDADPDTEEFRAAYAEQVRRLVRHLASDRAS